MEWSLEQQASRVRGWKALWEEKLAEAAGLRGKLREAEAAHAVAHEQLEEARRRLQAMADGTEDGREPGSSEPEPRADDPTFLNLVHWRAAQRS